MSAVDAEPSRGRPQAANSVSSAPSASGRRGADKVADVLFSGFSVSPCLCGDLVFSASLRLLVKNPFRIRRCALPNSRQPIAKCPRQTQSLREAARRRPTLCPPLPLPREDAAPTKSPAFCFSGFSVALFLCGDLVFSASLRLLVKNPFRIRRCALPNSRQPIAKCPRQTQSLREAARRRPTLRPPLPLPREDAAPTKSPAFCFSGFLCVSVPLW